MPPKAKFYNACRARVIINDSNKESRQVNTFGHCYDIGTIVEIHGSRWNSDCNFREYSCTTFDRQPLYQTLPEHCLDYVVSKLGNILV